MIIKRSPEDFFVRELISLPIKDSGKYLYFIMKKRDLTTAEALSRLAKCLRIPVKNFGFAGLKDRRAVTEQFCSVSGISKDRLGSVSLEGIDVEFVGFGDAPIHKGQNDGNFFRIVVRDASPPSSRSSFLNLFGEQRFSKHNADVGRALVKRDWSAACSFLYRLKLVDGCDNPLRSIRSVSSNMLRFFVHAYQSLLWNRAAVRCSENVEELPIVGFGSDDVDDCTQSVLDEEGVSPRDFVIRELPDVSCEGGSRSLFVQVKDLSIEGKEGCYVVEFSLPSGSYATVFIASLFAR